MKIGLLTSIAKPLSSSRIFQSEILTRPMFLPSLEVFLVLTSLDRASIDLESGLRRSFGFGFGFGEGVDVTGVVNRFGGEVVLVGFLIGEVF